MSPEDKAEIQAIVRSEVAQAARYLIVALGYGERTHETELLTVNLAQDHPEETWGWAYIQAEYWSQDAIKARREAALAQEAAQ